MAAESPTRSSTIQAVATKQNTDAQPADAGDIGTRVRLQKHMAAAGVGSRRACERMISEGQVMVNGEVVRDLPVLVDPAEDRISVKGLELPRAPRARAKANRKIYVMLYKPRQTLSTLHDPDGRRTVRDLVQHPSRARLYPVGRLDYDTMGLVLLTNDGEFANRLTHPSFGVRKTYRAIVKGALGEEDVAKLEEGIYLAERRDGRTDGASRTKPATLEIVRREPARTILDITLSEGRNRQVRRMLARVGCPVRKLTRIRIGPVRLKGVRLGEWRELSASEVGALKRAVGMTRARREGRSRKAAS